MRTRPAPAIECHNTANLTCKVVTNLGRASKSEVPGKYLMPGFIESGADVELDVAESLCGIILS